MSLPGYDAWKTTEPEYVDEHERPDGCECRRRIGDYRWCPVHGKDPDHALEEMRDRNG